MAVSKYKKEKLNKLKETAVTFYKQGFSSREIENMLAQMGEKKSHTWVMQAVKELSPSK